MQPFAVGPGAIVSILGFLSLAISAPMSVGMVSAALTAPVTGTAAQLERSHKADRLGPGALIGGKRQSTEPSTVTRLEAVDVTVAAKDASLPAVPAREHGDAATKPASPIKTLREERKERRLEGCDPLVSPLASASLAVAVGRCIASAAPAQKLAPAIL